MAVILELTEYVTVWCDMSPCDNVVCLPTHFWDWGRVLALFGWETRYDMWFCPDHVVP